MVSPSTTSLTRGSGSWVAPAGSVLAACTTEPSTIENRLPWQGQLMVPSATPSTVQPWWVQVALNPAN